MRLQKLSLFFLFCAAVWLPSLAWAVVDCPAAKVVHVQVENDAVYVYLEGQNWHLLGTIEHVATKMKLALVLAAQISGKRVMLRYPNGFNCSASEMDTPSLVVRTLD